MEYAQVVGGGFYSVALYLRGKSCAENSTPRKSKTKDCSFGFKRYQKGVVAGFCATCVNRRPAVVPDL